MLHKIKKVSKKAVEKTLGVFARAAIRKFRPEVIAITGSVGKTTTKDGVYHVLSPYFPVRTPKKSYNTEIGLPLAIFDEEVPFPLISPIGWTKILTRALFKLARKNRLNEKLILEMGADKPGDIEYLTSIARPDVAVVTRVAHQHTKEFKNILEIADEKGKIVKALRENGVAVLNGDDAKVADMKRYAQKNVILFGFKKQFDVSASGIKLTPLGMTFELKTNDGIRKVRSTVFGRHMIYPLLAAAAVATHYKIPLPKIVNRLESFKASPGRMNLVRGTKGSWIIDDSYNSNPEAAIAALETLSEITAKRKIAALGNINELGMYAEEGHRKVGAVAAKHADLLVTVGQDAKNYLADEAIKKGLSKERVFNFNSSKEAGDFLDGILKKGDIVLVKGSQNEVRMEWAVAKIMAEPHKANELLARQGPEWK